jgi:hypothetical protein
MNHITRVNGPLSLSRYPAAAALFKRHGIKAEGLVCTGDLDRDSASGEAEHIILKLTSCHPNRCVKDLRI